MKFKLIVVVILVVIFAVYFSQAQKTNSTLEIYFLNVSQGDSSFFRIDNYTMLVDCGPSNKVNDVIAYLNELNVYKIDYLVITHTDYDHIGGCADILHKFYVKNVIMDGQKRDTINYQRTIAEINSENLIIAKKYSEFDLGRAKVKILHSNTGSPDPNQNSIVLMVYFGNSKILMDADCDLGCENELINEDIDSDILKVPHHGSKYGSAMEFLNKVSPKLAIIEVGENNYGHPANETLERLKKFGNVLRTDVDGTIVLKVNSTWQ